MELVGAGGVMRFPTQGLLPDASILLPRKLTSVCKPLHVIHHNGSQNADFRSSSKEVVAALMLHHLDEPSGKDSLPSWRTVCI